MFVGYWDQSSFPVRLDLSDWTHIEADNLAQEYSFHSVPSGQARS